MLRCAPALALAGRTQHEHPARLLSGRITRGVPARRRRDDVHERHERSQCASRCTDGRKPPAASRASHGAAPNGVCQGVGLAGRRCPPRVERQKAVDRHAVSDVAVAVVARCKAGFAPWHVSLPVPASVHGRSGPCGTRAYRASSLPRAVGEGTPRVRGRGRHFRGGAPASTHSPNNKQERTTHVYLTRWPDGSTSVGPSPSSVTSGGVVSGGSGVGSTAAAPSLQVAEPGAERPEAHRSSARQRPLNEQRPLAGHQSSAGAH